MPSIGAATGIIVHQRIEAGIELAFNAKDRKAAHHFLRLSRQAGNGRFFFLVWLAYFILSLAYLTVAGATTGTTLLGSLLGAGSILLAAYGMVRSLKRSWDARRQIDDLRLSDSGYWDRIAERLKPIILNAGKFEDGLPPGQATRVQ